MKKAELIEGKNYWISKNSKWDTNPDREAGWEGIFTGETLGLEAEFVDLNNETHHVRYVDVRATFSDAEDKLIHLWDAFEAAQEQLAKIRRMANVVMGSDRFGIEHINGIENGSISINADQLEVLLNTARRAQKDAKR